MTLSLARRVLQIEADAIRALSERLDERFDQAVALVHDCGGRVVVTGMGKSGIVCRKIAATLNSTGTPSLYLAATTTRMVGFKKSLCLFFTRASNTLEMF